MALRAPILPFTLCFILAALFLAAGDVYATEKSSIQEISLNHLKYEKSPYLLQHADNPVDWYPWGEEAFRKAKQEDKPIFLSIGYSTCHWCHVMERESFEDPEVGALMNEVFISIKADWEERPDIDDLYMTVSRLLNGSGGWPLNILMTPDKRPFYAATYILSENRYGRMGMVELIPGVRELWKTRRDDINSSADKILEAVQQVTGAGISGDGLDMEVLNRAFRGLSDAFDGENGGFGTAPKFPTPHNLLFLLRYWKRSGDKEALSVVEKTLNAIRPVDAGNGLHRSLPGHWKGLVPSSSPGDS